VYAPTVLPSHRRRLVMDSFPLPFTLFLRTILRLPRTCASSALTNGFRVLPLFSPLSCGFLDRCRAVTVSTPFARTDAYYYDASFCRWILVVTLRYCRRSTRSGTWISCVYHLFCFAFLRSRFGMGSTDSRLPDSYIGTPFPAVQFAKLRVGARRITLRLRSNVCYRPFAPSPPLRHRLHQVSCRFCAQMPSLSGP